MDRKLELEQAVLALIKVMTRDIGLQKLVDEASRMLGRPIWVVDLRYRLLTNPDSVFPTSEKIAAEYQAGMVGREDLLFLHQKKLIDAIDHNGYPYIFFNEPLQMNLVVVPVRVKGIVVARLTSCEIDRPLTETDLSFLDKLKDLLSLEFQRGGDGTNRSQTVFSHMMGEMLEQKCTTMDHVLNLMDAAGYTLNPELRLAVIYVPKSRASEFPWHTVAEQLAVAFPNSIYTDFEGNMVLLINQKWDVNAVQMEEFNQTLRECGLRAVLSYRFHDLAKCYRVYYDTCSLIFASAHISSGSVCVRYEDHIPELTASLLAGRIDPHSIAGDAVGKLLDYDRKYGQETMATLRAYVKCAFSIKRTAAVLHIHENTLRYRISRIADLTGLDYKSGKTAFELMLAFALLDEEHRD